MERSGMEAPERRCESVYTMFCWDVGLAGDSQAPAMLVWPSHNTVRRSELCPHVSDWGRGDVFFVRALYFIPPRV